MPEAAHRQQQQQAQHGDYAEAHRGGVHPDHGLTAAEPAGETLAAAHVQRIDRFFRHHSDPYLIRSRWRMISASVLTTKVNRNSTKAARNRTR